VGSTVDARESVILAPVRSPSPLVIQKATEMSSSHGASPLHAPVNAVVVSGRRTCWS